MFLLVHPNGSKYWRMKFSFERKSKLASFGVWPDVSLKDAREKRYEAKKKIKDGINPVDEKRQERQHKRIGSGPREYELPSLNECRFFFAEKYSLDTDIFEIG